MKSITPNQVYYLAIILFLFVSVIYSIRKKTISNNIFLGWLLCYFLLNKIPTFYQNFSIGIDEGQMVAQAISVWNGLVFWSDIDFTTSGPINTLFLIPISLFNGSFDYTTCRIAFFILCSLSISYNYYTISILYNQILARVLAFFIVFFLVSTSHYDFQHYASELVSVTFLSGSLYFAVKGFLSTTRYSVLYWLLNGVLLGMIPFAKIQSLPLVFILFIYGCFLIIKKTHKWKPNLLFFILGISTLPLIIVFYLFYNESFNDFLFLYIEQNLIHGNEENFLISIAKFVYWFKLDSLNVFLYLTTFCFLLFLIVNRFKNQITTTEKLPYFHFFVFTYTFLAVFAITKSGYFFEHYFYYILFFSSILNAVFLSNIFRNDKYLKQINVFLLIISISSFFYFKPRIVKNHVEIVNKSTFEFINDFKQKEERIAVWGWNFDFYVRTNSPQGGLENHVTRLFITSHPQMTDKLIIKYVESLKRLRPVFFIDALNANSFWKDRNFYNFNHFPTIDNYIKTNYVLFKTIEDNIIYLRKDRFEKLTKSKN